MAKMKTCFFMGCSNTSQNSPRKLFLTVPKAENIRRLWFKSALNTTIFPTTPTFCCEDHFNLETDSENWSYFKTMGARLKIKKHVVPRNIRLASGNHNESQLTRSAEKRKEETLKEGSKSPTVRIKRKLFESGDSVAGTSCPKPTSPLHAVKSPSGKFRVSLASEGKTQQLSLGIKKRKTTCTQTDQKRVCSVGVWATTTVAHKATNTATTNKAVLLIARPQKVEPIDRDAEVSEPSDVPSSFIKTPSASSVSSTVKSEGYNTEVEKIQRNLRMYTGLPEDASFLLKALSSEGKLSSTDILLTLKKIRTNDSFSRLAIDFGYSSSYPGKIFDKTVPIMAGMLQELIFWPSEEKLRRLQPQQFWSNYKNVQSIIDCFEIEIQKPSAAYKQAITWSQYKSCNTAKYLISSTTNGHVNFISAGFCGRTSDKEIVINSGYLELLPPNCQVLADRGFKQVAQLLEEKMCELVRPPSVHSGVKQTKAEVRLSKLVASLRIHIERVIRRLREFKMLAPHAAFSTKLLPHLDNCVIIACAIINMQGPLIKQHSQ